MRVCIIQPVLKAYREPFFRQLESALAASGIALTVQYGRPWAEEAGRGDNITLAPPLGWEAPNVRLGGGLMLQPTIKPWWGADLVVVEHANKHALNYLLAMAKGVAFRRLAYWGHGLNRQGDPASLAERFKRRSLHWADWWFAYSAGAANYVAAQGFDVSRITTVENAVDTRSLRSQVGRWSDVERNQRLGEWGWRSTDMVAVYCGSLYPNKRLDMLIEAGLRIRSQVEGFRLVVVGGGPQAHWMADQASRHAEWLRYEGPRFGAEKAACLALAQVCLNPGLVGLGILDAFAAGLPLITTNIQGHGPEMEYLDPGSNGHVTEPSTEHFATCIVALLRDPVRLEAMRAGARASAARYSIETMVNNFSGGVRKCLAQ